MTINFNFSKSWRTTVSGVVAGLAGYVMANPADFPHWAHVASSIVMSGALTSLGFAAKDAAVHSTAGEVTVATAEKAAEDNKGVAAPVKAFDPNLEPEVKPDAQKVPKW